MVNRPWPVLKLAAGRLRSNGSTGKGTSSESNPSEPGSPPLSPTTSKTRRASALWRLLIPPIKLGISAQFKSENSFGSPQAGSDAGFRNMSEPDSTAPLDTLVDTSHHIQDIPFKASMLNTDRDKSLPRLPYLLSHFLRPVRRGEFPSTPNVTPTSREGDDQHTITLVPVQSGCEIIYEFQLLQAPDKPNHNSQLATTDSSIIGQYTNSDAAEEQLSADIKDSLAQSHIPHPPPLFFTSSQFCSQSPDGVPLDQDPCSNSLPSFEDFHSSSINMAPLESDSIIDMFR
ncbi:hypothetical protein TREMEDRAFT_59514 [Tremella mesenterica DSM 1558]|uniref:uncharacterized protein n=1 Tax=Tremella mesenterica (strain ATCC 24925 / CBS 8224 / DSM 1558 / NBRC 9311 / NRRL Y-6157 / RJB 2259-6 / UBC 559-6) TaxID=578456 RepID=UPI0003F4A071|nr:uncharacterized protein TREMEDRAFT_59514 [Tremella mesenterica DSM 1558]EIW73348.1 hypothetical protein TREMEDRAFT_59514 [Tremella mesenterica DSM 1558]